MIQPLLVVVSSVAVANMSEEHESDEANEDGAVVRSLGVLLAPIAALGDALGAAVMGFFGFFEKLSVLELFRRLLAPLEPLAIRLRAWFGRVLDPIWRVVNAVVQGLFGWLRPVMQRLQRVIGVLTELLRRRWAALLRATESARHAIVALAGRVRESWSRATEPLRRARAHASAWVDRVRHAVRRR